MLSNTWHTSDTHTDKQEVPSEAETGNRDEAPP